MIQQLTAQLWAIGGLFRSFQTFVPPMLREISSQWWLSMKDYFNVNCYLEIPHHIEKGVEINDLYCDALLYYSILEGAVTAPIQTAFKSANSSILNVTADCNQLIHDSFQGVRVCWMHESILEKTEGRGVIENNSFVLKVNNTTMDFFTAYLEHISSKVEELREQKREITIGVNDRGSRYWTDLPFHHPSTFSTLALDPSTKDIILSDLKRFKQAKNFYRRIGRAWKRGYLLYGPPGTGKTSLIAAIANYMKYDVCDLELTNVNTNVDLRLLLAGTEQKTIIIIEDIDCSLGLSDRASHKPSSQRNQNGRVTLSGLLNFIDGLWSCCGEERIFIFTTNHREYLDPALLRCGRMDVHINLSYCSFFVFKTLAFNYLRIEDHALYSAIEQRISAGAEMTPAEIIEVLGRRLNDPNTVLTAVIAALDGKIKEKESARFIQSAEMGNEGYR